MRRACLLMLSVGVAAGQAKAQQTPPAPVLEAVIDGDIETRNIRVAMDETGRSAPVLWEDQIAEFGADYIRLHITSTGAAFPAGSELRITPSFGPVQAVDLAKVGPEGIWSGLIGGARARLAVVATDGAAGAVLEIGQVMSEASGIALFSAWGTNDIRPVYDAGGPQSVAVVAPSVAMLSFIEDGTSHACTGFLIAADVILTNEHCVRSAAACASMTAVFGYEYDANGTLGMGPQARCTAYLPDWSNFEADVTAIRIDPPPGAGFAPVTIGAQQGEPPPEALFIVQHPGPLPKHVSFLDCAWDRWPVDGRAPETDFSHTCDTAKGSSGAPVFDLDGRLVGIHHFGFADSPSEIWTENRGVRIGPVVTWLSEQQLP